MSIGVIIFILLVGNQPFNRKVDPSKIEESKAGYISFSD